jgi:hypothetical protein
VTPEDRTDGLSNCIEGLGDPSIDTRLQTYRTWHYQPPVEELEQEFQQNWMAYIEVWLLASTMFRAGYDLINVEPEIDTAAVASYAEGDLHVGPDGSLQQTKGMSWYARELKIQGDKFGGAALFPILDDGLDPREPLNLNRIERVRGWTVFDRREITPVPTGRNTLPQYYMLSDVVGLDAASNGTRVLAPGDVIHRSRLRFNMGREGMSARAQRNRNWWGFSVLELNERARLAAERASEHLSSFIAKASWLHYSMAMLDELLQRKDAAGNEVGEEWLRRRMLAFRKNATNFGIAVTDGGREAYNTESGQMIPARPGDSVESIIESSGDLSKIADYKQVEWARGAGLPPGVAFSDSGNTGLRGGEDGGAWQKFGGDVQAAQNGEDGTGCLNWMYTIAFSARQGPTSGMRPKSWTIRWKPLRLPTPMEIAEIAKAQAEADRVRIESGVIKALEVRDQRLVRGDTDGPLRVSDDTTDEGGVGPAQVGIASALLEIGLAAGRGEVTPEFVTEYVRSIDEPRFAGDAAQRFADSARPKTAPSAGVPGAATDPLAQVLPQADAEPAAEEPEPFSTDPRPSDLMTPGDLAEIVTARFGISQGSQSINAMARRHDLRRWKVGTSSGYSKAEIIAAYEGQHPPDVAEPVAEDESTE